MTCFKRLWLVNVSLSHTAIKLSTTFRNLYYNISSLNPFVTYEFLKPSIHGNQVFSGILL